MCVINPGPRCSSHTRKKLDAYDRRLGILQAQFISALELSRREDSPSAKKRMARIAARINKIERKREIAQIDYDGTPVGLSELESRLCACPEGREKRVLQARINKAKSLRAWRKNALSKPFDRKFYLTHVV